MTLSQVEIFKEEFDIIKKYVDHKEIISIILYGGYGRNEGAEYIDEKGNRLLFNDIDLLLIVKNKISSTTINKFKKKLLNEINITWIDFTQYTISQLKRSNKSVFFYDLKYSSIILKGDKNILSNIPNFSNKKIEYNEIKILFTSRIWCFLGCFDEKGIGPLNGFKSAFFKNQISKAVFGIIDSILISENCYVTHYKQKKELFLKEYASKYPELTKYIEFAFENKFSPNREPLNKTQTEKIYRDVSFQFLTIMSEILGKINGKKISSGFDLASLFKNDLRLNLKSILFKILNNEKQDELNILICRIFSLYCVFDEKYNEFSLKYFNKIKDKNTLSEFDFDFIRSNIVILKFNE